MGLEERERIDALDRDGEAIRHHGYFTNYAVAASEKNRQLEGEQAAHEARLAVDFATITDAEVRAVGAPRAGGLSAEDVAAAERILRAMFASRAPQTREDH